jgi:prephenate dehydratase
MTRIAYQGEPGAYSEAAVFEHFGPSVEGLPCTSFDDVFAAVEKGKAESALVPIENSLAGTIHRNYDLLLQNSMSVVGEHYLHVHHCLITHPGTKRTDIKCVISHPQALAQCETYLRSFPGVKVEPTYDTAGSVKILRDQGDPSVAAIASQRAAGLYGMSILERNIEDAPNNFTRFLNIAPQPVFPETDAKTTIVFSLKNQPGSLFKALSVFALRDIDLTKIESRPLVGKSWEYLFYIDFTGSTGDENVARALNHLSEYAFMLRVFGSYPRHHYSES